jgi:hypothetical protein
MNGAAHETHVSVKAKSTTIPAGIDQATLLGFRGWV